MRRLLTAIGLAWTPALLLWSIQSSGAALPEESFAAITLLYFFLPTMLCGICSLLWAAPIVYAEVESGGWSYLAVRPYGKGALLLGKYLSAVFWTTITGWISLGTCSFMFTFPAGAQIVEMFAGLILLSAFAYGALCVLLGVLFLRRGMVAVVAYAVIIEGITAFLPAVIRYFTVQYHLRSLLFQWTPVSLKDYDLQRAMQWFQEDLPWWVHVAALTVYTGVLLAAAWAILYQRELAKPQEN